MTTSALRIVPARNAASTSAPARLLVGLPEAPLVTPYSPIRMFGPLRSTAS
jgi:hypothetical protein